jgi:hypothetical protein
MVRRVAVTPEHRRATDILRNVRRRLLLLILGLLLVGCGGSTTADGPDGAAAGSTGAVTSEAAVTDGASAGHGAPFGTVTLVDGGSLDGAEYAGDDLALWFWAPW